MQSLHGSVVGVVLVWMLMQEDRAAEVQEKVESKYETWPGELWCR